MVYQEAYELRAEDPELSGPGVTRLAGWLGALTSVALVAGLVWWVADLALRDVRGVPVVRAMEGPARLAPEDPGGFRAAHQGYAVNSIASDGDPIPLSDRITLAPEATGVASEDRPTALLEPAAQDAAMRSAIGAALQEAIGTDFEDGSLSAPNGASDATAPVGLRPLSPRPQQRPDPEFVTRASATTGFAPVSSSPPAGPQAGVADLASVQIPPGTRLVQLGAFDSIDSATAAWARLSAEFEGYLDSKGRVIEQAELQGQSFWRLRAHGFDDLAQARSFCAVLMAGAAECIPVLTR